MKRTTKKTAKTEAEIFRLIKRDHRAVSGLFSKLSKTSERSEKTREKLYEELRTELSLHAQAEENAVYPRLQALPKTASIGYEAEEEHDLMKHLFHKLDGMDASEERWTAALEVLKEIVEHHVEEEESEVFKKMRASFDMDELNAMGKEFIDFKEYAAASPIEKIKRVIGA